MSFLSVHLIHTVTRGIKTDGFATATKQPIITYVDSTGIKCRLDPLTGKYAETILGKYPKASYLGNFEASQSLAVGDKITVTVGPSGDGVVGKVFMVVDVAVFGAHHLEAVLERFNI